MHEWTAVLIPTLQGKPLIRKAMIVSPASLIHNFAKEAKRWLGSERLKVAVLQPGPDAAQQVMVALNLTVRLYDCAVQCSCTNLNHRVH